MPYDPTVHHGNAHYRSWMQVPVSAVVDIIADEEPTNLQGCALSGARYAQLVYQVNSTPLSLSGDVNVDNSTLEGLVSGTNERLDDICEKLVSGVIKPGLAIYIEEEGLFTWVAEAEAGTPLSASDWRIRQIEETVSGSFETTRITWADGSKDFIHDALPPLSGNTFY